ncbi:MAG: 30S ribosomal protein S6 [Kordiimonas sp.]|nr:30S ribosomal protein S6 [Kordiimonas sp.]|tara:strand:- start:1539 stop:1928 length:390 start_codon:yes stop_codon:yes gene_type:complete
MPLYEHVYIARQDIQPQQVEAMTKEFTEIVEKNGGSVASNEYWGLRNLAYRINKNRKGHYVLLNLDVPPAALAELERNERLNEDVIRFMSIKVDEHIEGPSVVMQSRGNERGERGERNDRGGERRPRRD